MYCVLKLLWSKRMPLQLTVICLTYYLMFGFFLFNPFHISVFQPFFSRANLFCLFLRWLSWKQDHHSEGGWIEKVTWTCILYHVSNRQLGGHCSIMQGAQLSALIQMGTGGGGRLKREGICGYLTLIHIFVQQKLTQYCKGIILQMKN